MFKEFFKTEELNEEQKHQENKDPIKVLRANRIKIKSVNPTNFGIEIELAKKYDDDLIDEILKDFKFKKLKNFIFV